MRTPPAAVFYAALLWFCASAPALAQDYVPTTVTFSGTELSQAELLAFTGLRPGEQVSREQMQAAADKLTGSGLFIDARFSFDGETLQFDLKPSPAVVPVEYDNFPWWDDAALNAAVAARVPLFHGAIYPGGPMREEVTAVLAGLLETKGVRGPVITTAAVGNESHDQVAIRYHIDTPTVVVGTFHIENYSGVWTQPLEAVEKSAAGEKIDGSIRDKLADEVREVYGSRGFIDMTMTAPAWGTPLLVTGEIAVPVRATITSEGGQYHVEGMHLTGDVFMTQEEFEKRAKLHSGDVANEEVWTQIKEMVAAPYRTHGYLDAKIDAAPTLDRAQHTVDYTITVVPGAVYHMGKLTLVNLDEKQKAELMPYWLLHKGDVFNGDLIPQSVVDYHRLRAGELQSIHAGFTAKWAADQGTRVVDVVVTFEPTQK